MCSRNRFNRTRIFEFLLDRFTEILEIILEYTRKTFHVVLMISVIKGNKEFVVLKRLSIVGLLS